MILPCLYIASTPARGRGVFTHSAIAAGTVVETAPVVVMSRQERELLDQTKLHDYIFEWGEQKQQCCMALGYAAVYNHSYSSNCEYEMDFENREVRIVAIRAIEAGEELFINYNGDWNNGKPLWFEVK